MSTPPRKPVKPRAAGRAPDATSAPAADLATMAAQRKADLRERLIAAASAEIAEKGLSSLKAREVTRRAGCALGALYTVFEDLDALVLQVNSRTLALMGQSLRAALPTGQTSPETVTLALAHAYVDFALVHRARWSALFALHPERPMPDWHRQEHEYLIGRIIAPLARLRPDLPPERMLLRVRTLFGAVHGVVQLSLQDHPIGLPHAQLQEEITALVTAMTLGARQLAQG
ncbi:TetR/AcrR family transcriptional regulator [Gemmobacter serpentinus]|uniref:TetR/AcrR family transcriptional regulator n=1 Tax=Gemmobacter serpentinus TaxID=2652247 RepID=UPI001CF6A47C|nr:TetR/AcrR family transcriptional regulator [Gemmobacter serpentinus]